MPEGTRDIPLEDRLIVALDMDEEAAIALVRRLRPQVRIFKVGLQMLMGSGGLGILRRLRQEDAQVFLDLKMLDIPETVGRALNEVRTRHGNVVFTTIHAFSRGLDAVLRAGGDSRLQVLVVTLLTSMDEADLRSLGIDKPVQPFVMDQARRAEEAGCHGVIASALEAAAIRAAHPGLTIVTPGIRPAWAQVAGDDQKRVATPRDAILAGADHIVMGRPIYGFAADQGGPEEAVRRVLDEIRQAIEERAQADAPDGSPSRAALA